MPVRHASAEWRGDLQAGNGVMALGSGAFEGQYSFGSRFAEGTGTNPEELIGAAHAGCFSMALSALLAEAGHPPTRVQTTAAVHLEKTGEGFGITRIDLNTIAQVPGIDAATFQKLANDAKAGCPVSQALAAVPEIILTATLE